MPEVIKWFCPSSGPTDPPITLHYGPYNSLRYIFFKIILIRHPTYFVLFTQHLNINQCCKAIQIYQNPTCIDFKALMGMHMLLTLKPFMLESCNFCVLSQEKSAPLTNFQPNWTTRNKVSDFF